MFPRAALILMLACGAEKSAEMSGSAAPKDRAPVAGADEDPCAGGKIVGMSSGSGVPKIEQDEPTVSGDIDRALIKRIVNQQIPAIRKCYADGGDYKVKVVFTIATDGTVPKADATGGPQVMMDCLGGVFRGLKFPTSPGAVTISYPLVFHPVP